MNVVLAVTYHDPGARLIAQIERTLPFLKEVFSGIAVRASHLATPRALTEFETAGASVLQVPATSDSIGARLGKARKQAVELALRLETETILYCDCDRILHWVERFPEELCEMLVLLPQCDFYVLGRTERAFQSHPRVQRDTEAIVNHIFSLVSGECWDVMAGARGLSRRAAQALLSGCGDEELSVDVSWPLYLQSLRGYTLGYLQTEGLEFETQDRYPDRVAAAGGLQAWIAEMDSSLETWLHRLDYIPLYIKAMEPFFPS